MFERRSLKETRKSHGKTFVGEVKSMKTVKVFQLQLLLHTVTVAGVVNNFWTRPNELDPTKNVTRFARRGLIHAQLQVSLFTVI